MKNRKKNWAMVDRRSGESFESWKRRNHKARVNDWVAQKKASGEWLSAEDYAKATGRPGRTGSDDRLFARGKNPAAAEPSSARTRKAPRTGPANTGTSVVKKICKDSVGSGATAAVGTVLGDLISQGRNIDWKSTGIRAAESGVAAAGRNAAARTVEHGLEKAVAAVAAKSAAGAAVAQTGKQLARSAVKEGTKRAVQTGASQAARSVLRGNAVTSAAFFLVDQGVDSALLVSGEIDRHEYKCRTVENGAGAVGGLGGMAAGAAIGSVVPVVGTAIGAFVGGMFGSIFGRWGAGKVVR